MFCDKLVPLPAPMSTSTPFLSVLPQPRSPKAESSTMTLTVEDGGPPAQPAPLAPTSVPASAVTESRRSSAITDVFSQSAYGSGEWYPTMQRCLYILGKLYRCVPVSTFADMMKNGLRILSIQVVWYSVIIRIDYRI